MTTKCRRSQERLPITSDSQDVENITNQQMIIGILELLEEAVDKRMGLIDTFSDTDQFQRMLCGYCCDEYDCELSRRKGNYDIDDDQARFIGKFLHDNPQRDREMFDRAIKIASMYVTLALLVKQKSHKKWKCEL